MKKFILLIIILSGLAVFVASLNGQEKQKFIERFSVESAIVKSAKKWDGRHYRYGQSYQCANWVGEVVENSGGKPPENFSLARSWLSWGRPALLGSIRPGDIIVTWRGSKYGSSGHVLIYLGDGTCIHRPTHSRAVCKTPISHYEAKILGIRRK
tara:strand:- start:717 stop:1178 length:462 start_codon:yes stop_codon:yes gene_type:complete